MPPEHNLTLGSIIVKQKKSRVSVGTLLGLFVGLGLFFSAIAMATNRYMLFVSFPSALMVVGGTLANAFISYQGIYVLRALSNVKSIFGHARINERIYYAESRKVIQWARLAKQAGLLGLDRHVKTTETHDHFLRYGVHLVVDGYKPKAVRQLLTNSIHSSFERAQRQVEVLRNMADTAPAFGMIGTLVGLVIMLDSLSSNPEDLGAGLAVALLTTLYGVLVARLVFQPAADKTQQRAEIARFRACLVLEGLVMLAEQRSPRYIQDRINSFLDPDVVHAMQAKDKDAPAKAPTA